MNIRRKIFNEFAAPSFMLIDYLANVIVPPNKTCQKSRSIFSVGRIEKGTDLVRI